MTRRRMTRKKLEMNTLRVEKGKEVAQRASTGRALLERGSLAVLPSGKGRPRAQLQHEGFTEGRRTSWTNAEMGFRGLLCNYLCRRWLRIASFFQQPESEGAFACCPFCNSPLLLLWQ